EEDAEADAKAKEEADAKAEEEAKAKEEADKAAEEKAKEEKAAEEGKVTGGTITREDSSDPVVEETVINTSWEPVGTKQTGKHVSVYDKGSVDWNEKINAISY